MREIVATTRIVIPLGKQGENEATVVKFPISGWDELYGSGAFELVNVRPSENTPYTCSITVDDNFVYWVVQAADVALVGHGKCELTYVVNGLVAKSLQFATCVSESIEGSGTVPAPYESRIADLIEQSAEITINAGRAEDAANSAERFAGNASSSADDAAGSARDASGSARDAAGSANDADNSADDSEAYAKGTRNGADVGSSDPAYHNNSKYFSEQAGTSAGNAETSETNALSHQRTAERYAKGTEDGAAVPSGVGYHDNAKYYKELADADALKAEGYAVGKQSGEDVGSQSQYYHNNAKYYSQRSAGYAEDSAEAVGVYKATDLTIANGSVTNPANSNAVSTSYAEIHGLGIASCVVTRPLDDDAIFYAFCYTVYDSTKTEIYHTDWAKAENYEKSIPINDPNIKYIRFTIVQYTEDGYISLRTTNFTSDDVYVEFVAYDSIAFSSKDTEASMEDICEKKHVADLWCAGAWAFDNGGWYNWNGYVRSQQTIPDIVRAIRTSSDYKMYLLAYNASGYVGLWNGGCFSTVFHSLSTKVSFKYINFAELREKYPNYIFRITAAGETGVTITASDFAQATTIEYSLVSQIRTQNIVSYGDFCRRELWENGTIVSDGSKNIDSYLKRVSTLDFLKFPFPVTIIPKSGYAYSITTYDEQGTKIAQFTAWQTLPYTFTNVDFLYKINIKAESNTEISPYNIADYMEAHFLYSMPFNRTLAEYANVKAVNHRGFNTVAPENTLPAFEMSADLGFKYVECDVLFTSDGVPVIMHDDTINRTARNPDGSELSETVYIADITYEQALEYDYGIYKGQQYAGTKIPTFAEFMHCCKARNLHPWIELKYLHVYTQSEIQQIISIIKQYGMDEHVTFISFSYDALALVVAEWDTVEVGLNGTIANASLLKTGKNRVFMIFSAGLNISDAVAAGFQVCLYTVDNTDVLYNLPRQGYDSILTNGLMPSQIVDTVRRKYEVTVSG